MVRISRPARDRDDERGNPKTGGLQRAPPGSISGLFVFLIVFQCHSENPKKMEDR
jgi:hypothetical protein